MESLKGAVRTAIAVNDAKCIGLSIVETGIETKKKGSARILCSSACNLPQWGVIINSAGPLFRVPAPRLVYTKRKAINSFYNIRVPIWGHVSNDSMLFQYILYAGTASYKREFRMVEYSLYECGVDERRAPLESFKPVIAA